MELEDEGGMLVLVDMAEEEDEEEEAYLWARMGSWLGWNHTP
jgi:hypothetical protein